MSVKRQQVTGTQQRLFDEAESGPVRHPEAGDAGSGAGSREAPQALAARAAPRALPAFVMANDAGLTALVAHYDAVATTNNRRGTRRVRPVV